MLKHLLRGAVRIGDSDDDDDDDDDDDADVAVWIHLTLADIRILSSAYEIGHEDCGRTSVIWHNSYAMSGM